MSYGMRSEQSGTRWVTVSGRARLLSPSIPAILPVSCVWLGMVGTQVANMFDAPVSVSIPVFFGLAALGIGVLLLVFRRRNPSVEVDLDRALLRAGRRTVPLVEIDSARVYAFGKGSRRASALVLMRGKRRAAQVDLRARARPRLSDEQRRMLAEAITASTISMPHNTDDPSGRFAGVNFPFNVTKEEALALVLEPEAPAPTRASP